MSREEVSSSAVERALMILEAVGQRTAGLTNAEISRRLEIPKSSASYLLRTLERRGYLKRDAAGRYRLGRAVLELARGVQSDGELKERALPILQRLVRRTELTAHLATLDAEHGEAVYIEKVNAPGFIQMNTAVGVHMPINATGVGKALVAYLSAPETEAVLRKGGFRKRTPHTITSRGEFLHELEKVRRQGYGVDDEENSLGARCVAAPVFDAFGRVVAAVGVSGTTGQIDKAAMVRTAELVKEAARDISRLLGHRRRSGE